jgi:carboxylesterase
MLKRLKKISVIFLIVLLVIIILLRTKLESPSFDEVSLDNPDSYKPEDTKPRILESDSDIGVVLVHGLGASPWETKDLAEYLHSKNITTSQVLLAGHGKSIYELEQTSYQEWYGSVDKAYNELQTAKKFIIGSSTGSLLAIEISKENSPDGTVLLSTPLVFNNKLVKYTPFLKYLTRYSHRDIGEIQKQFYHENFPVKSLAEMVHYINKIKNIIPDITPTTLIIQSRNDPRLKPESAQYVYDNIGSENKEILWLDSYYHVLIIDQIDEANEFKDEKKEIFEKIYSFILGNSR